MNYKLIITLLVIVIAVSGCLESKTITTNINREYKVVSVNEYYITGSITHSITFIDIDGVIRTITDTPPIYLTIYPSNKTYLIQDYQTSKCIISGNDILTCSDRNIYGRLYLSNTTSIEPKDATWNKLQGKMPITVHSDGRKIS